MRDNKNEQKSHQTNKKPPSYCGVAFSLRGQVAGGRLQGWNLNIIMNQRTTHSAQRTAHNAQRTAHNGGF
ncbi:MAG: hypothetical protein FWD49_00020 [Firmicutes bacterium]|nr:hypothetical protein [Bacillota bacterium]